MRSFNDDDDLGYLVKHLPGVVMDSRRWAVVPDGIYLVEPRRFERQAGGANHGPRGVLECEIVLPSDYCGIAVTWYCNAIYNPVTQEIEFAQNSKLANTARLLFPDAAKYLDPPTGCLLDHYLIGRITLARNGRKGGKVVEKAKERQYSKVSKLLAAGPRLQSNPNGSPVMQDLQRLLEVHELKESMNREP